MKNSILGIVVLSVAMFGCGDKKEAGAPSATPTTPATSTTSTTSTAADIAAGKVTAERDCKGCHGLEGGGAAPGIPHLAAQRERYLFASLKEYKDGKRHHAALRDLTGQMTESDMRQVAAYYASLPPVAAAAAKDIQVPSPYQEGRALAAPCAKCHGEDGNSKTPGTPSLAGQQPHYLAMAIQEYHEGQRSDPTMKSMLRASNKLDVEKLVMYFAAQVPAQRAAPSNGGDPVAGEPATAMCGGCHGSHGVSTDGATPTLAGQDAKYLVNAMKAYRSTRKNFGMQRYVAGLSEKDIQNIAAFYSIQKSKAADEMPASAKELAAKCDRCHDSDTNPSVAVPTMNGQDKDYLIMALRAYRDGKRESSIMHNMSFSYSNAIIDSISSWYASQPVDAKH
jgi:cytochrome c553